MFGIATINAVPEEIAANAEVWREKPWSEGGPCQNWKNATGPRGTDSGSG
jgi:hypothetical protein